MENETAKPAPRLLEQVRAVMRLHHDSIHTERSYVERKYPNANREWGWLWV